MLDNAIGMVLEVREPLLAVSKNLARHSSAVASSWRRLLRRSKLCGKHLKPLAGLALAPQLRNLASEAPESFRERAELQGHDLAREGIPPECVTVTLDLYLEACLPYLAANRPIPEESIQALIRASAI